jgi:hypothetical protein
MHYKGSRGGAEFVAFVAQLSKVKGGFIYISLRASGLYSRARGEEVDGNP